MTEFRIETERLVLRDWRRGDIDRFAELTNTPEVMRWLGGLLDRHDLANLEERVVRYQREFGHTFWIVERRDDGGHLSGEMLGFCGLKHADAPNSTIGGECEIGWRIREDSWGRGYAREAATASLDAAIDRFGARDVFAITIAENTMSWGLMLRLGMRRREDLDYRDPRYDPPWDATITYSITAEEWARQSR